MENEFIESNIVILGEFTPSNFDKLFFIKNNLIEEDEFLDSSIFTSNFSRIKTKELIINVSKEQIIIVDQHSSTNKKFKSITDKITNIFKRNISVIAFNFKYIIFIENISEFTKEQFYIQSNVLLNKHFNSKKAAYGYYISDDFLESRLKLDIKPMFLKEIDTNENKSVLSFDFNFHIENEEKDITALQALNNYQLYLTKVKEIISEYE
jgi:hypothetical protein